jgi:hypothetical protein
MHSGHRTHIFQNTKAVNIVREQIYMRKYIRHIPEHTRAGIEPGIYLILRHAGALTTKLRHIHNSYLCRSHFLDICLRADQNLRTNIIVSIALAYVCIRKHVQIVHALCMYKKTLPHNLT